MQLFAQTCFWKEIPKNKKNIKIWSLLQNRFSNLLACRNCEKKNIVRLSTTQYNSYSIFFHVKVNVRIYARVQHICQMIYQNICQNIRVCQLYVKCFVRLPIKLSEFVGMNVIFYVPAFLENVFAAIVITRSKVCLLLGEPPKSNSRQWFKDILYYNICLKQNLSNIENRFCPLHVYCTGSLFYYWGNL